MSTTASKPPVVLPGPDPTDGLPELVHDDALFPERVKSPRRSAVELLVTVTVIVVLATLAGALDLVIVLGALIAMVMLHELGHLLAAKRGGMKVTEYFLGFGPRLWSVRRGETEYGVKAIPAGGYVKIPGMTALEEVDPEDDPRTYREQPFHSRLLVAVAGSAMHFILGFLLIWVLLVFVGTGVSSQLQIQSFASIPGAANPAQQAGIRTGDIVVSVDGHRETGSGDVTAHQIQTHADRPVTVVVDRDGRDLTFTVTPVNARDYHLNGYDLPAGTAPYGIIGISEGNPTATENPIRSVGTAVVDLGKIMWASVLGVVHIFQPSHLVGAYHQATSARAASQAATNGTRVSSIVGAVRTADQAAHHGLGDLLDVLITIIVFLGVINLFPLLPFDGGHVSIAVYERIRSRKGRPAYHADVTKMMPFTWVVLGYLGLVVLFALTADLLHPATFS